MSKGGKQTVSSMPDPASQQWAQQVRNAASSAANSPGPNVSGSQNYYGGAMQAGNLGMSALSGDPNAVQSMMNPYQSNVIDAFNNQYQHTLGLTQQSVADQATRAGAFGGSRYGVALGTALAGANRDAQSTLAGLDQQGYNDAMGRAGTMANLGFGAAGASGNLAIASDPQMRQMQLMQMGNGVPTGQTQTTTGRPGSNPLTGVAGGALTGAQLGSIVPGIGTGLGAIGGGLLGLLGGM